jgi:hypothetical protein
MHPRTVLFLHLFDGPNLPPKACELEKFVLDSLQPFLPLAMRDVSIRLISDLTPILLVQLVNLSNLHPETPDLFPKNFKVIHTTRIAYLAV